MVVNGPRRVDDSLQLEINREVCDRGWLRWNILALRAGTDSRGEDQQTQISPETQLPKAHANNASMTVHDDA